MIGSRPSASTEQCYPPMPIPSTDTMTGTDYPDPGNWLRIPDVIHDVDTFYLYPTHTSTHLPAPRTCATSTIR